MRSWKFIFLVHFMKTLFSLFRESVNRGEETRQNKNLCFGYFFAECYDEMSPNLVSSASLEKPWLSFQVFCTNSISKSVYTRLEEDIKGIYNLWRKSLPKSVFLAVKKALFFLAIFAQSLKPQALTSDLKRANSTWFCPKFSAEFNHVTPVSEFGWEDTYNCLWGKPSLFWHIYVAFCV